MDAPRLIRLPEVANRVGKTKIYDLIKQNAFPKPVKVGKASPWSSEKVTRWIETQCD